jgi:hypothetical protein
MVAAVVVVPAQLAPMERQQLVEMVALVSPLASRAHQFPEVAAVVVEHFRVEPPGQGVAAVAAMLAQQAVTMLAQMLA